MLDLTNKRVIVTGGEGFLGHHLVSLLKEKCQSVYVVKHEVYDLCSVKSIHNLFYTTEPNIVIHLAAQVGGIQYNQLNPGYLFYQNLVMGMNLIHHGKSMKLDKLVCLGTICSYPISPPVPFREDDLWNGYPEPTNAGYGIAKRALLEMCQDYKKQYGMNCIFLMPTNLMGEFDDFSDERGHVIPMLIKRFVHAKENCLPEVIVWGSGNATREFLYAGDCAKAIVRATEIYDKPNPINIGSGQETSIKELAETIADIVGYKGKIVWDNSKPDGQPRRLLDITRMKTELNLDSNSFIPLREGLKKTIEWYKESISEQVQ